MQPEKTSSKDLEGGIFGRGIKLVRKVCLRGHAYVAVILKELDKVIQKKKIQEKKVIFTIFFFTEVGVF